MQLNPKRKQQYLDGDVGLINTDYDMVKLIEPDASTLDNTLWKGTTTPESFKPVEWFFEEDVMIPNTPTTDDYKEVIRELLNVYVINVNGRGELKTPLTDIMQLIDRAKSMINY